MFQLQAEHQHAAVLIDLLFKGVYNLLLQLLCYTSRLLTSASKNPLLRKRLYNKRLIIIILIQQEILTKEKVDEFDESFVSSIFNSSNFY